MNCPLQRYKVSAVTSCPMVRPRSLNFVRRKTPVLYDLLCVYDFVVFGGRTTTLELRMFRMNFERFGLFVYNYPVVSGRLDHDRWISWDGREPYSTTDWFESDCRGRWSYHCSYRAWWPDHDSWFSSDFRHFGFRKMENNSYRWRISRICPAVDRLRRGGRG